MTARRNDMSVANGRKAMDSIKYLASPNATKDAIERLKYWRSNPSLSDGIRNGNAMAMRSNSIEQLKGFYMIHQSLGKADVELQLLKRLNYISLWSTVMAMGDGGDDKKMLKEAKVWNGDACGVDDRRNSGRRTTLI